MELQKFFTINFNLTHNTETSLAISDKSRFTSYGREEGPAEKLMIERLGECRAKLTQNSNGCTLFGKQHKYAFEEKKSKHLVRAFSETVKLDMIYFGSTNFNPKYFGLEPKFTIPQAMLYAISAQFLNNINFKRVLIEQTQKIVITVRINNKSSITFKKKRSVRCSITSVCFRLPVGLAVGLLVAGVLVVACDIIISLG
ncbi:hypothetical protein BpHYR1_050315 [Brachionus plicatilis]|uniref:Uncharacterized protein n=1 Tax=Brachionus plicatilis TaxID=10195 RepID=A0A3M7SCZ5_BRAPC|nr:hypothetical protein BpHYR1_050315 [Brachionus plicatilis]